MDYILLVFGQSDNQELFVKSICEDISVISNNSNIKYYYGQDSVIVTFKSNEPIECIDAFLKMEYDNLDLVYLLLPYSTDNMSVKMTDDIYNHLFKDINISNEGVVQKLYKESDNSEEFETLFEEEFSNFSKLSKNDNSPKNEPTLDEILDKINLKGLSSLSKKELSLLNNYSNK